MKNARIENAKDKAAMFVFAIAAAGAILFTNQASADQSAVETCAQMSENARAIAIMRDEGASLLEVLKITAADKSGASGKMAGIIYQHREMDPDQVRDETLAGCLEAFSI